MATSAMVLAQPAVAQGNANSVYSFSIPAQDLARALSSYSRVTGLQIIADTATLSQQRSGAVNGRFTAETALRQLTGGKVSATIVGATVVVKPARIARATARPEPASVPMAAIAAVDVADTAPDADTSAEGADLIVTGSRIARPELESAMPIGVINMETAMRAGNTSAYETILRDIAVGPGNGPYNSAPEGQYDGGMATIELRNMGVSRSLTLVDGRRRVSGAASSSAVDINMIPSGMIERIEIVTGGAAAVYGADAVTGAANIITRKNIQGFELSATTGTTQHGGGSKSQVSLVAGTRFADNRGSIVIGGTWMKNDPIYFHQRYSKDTNLSYQTNPANTGPADGIPDRIVRYNMTNMYLQPVANIFVGGKTYLLQPDGSALLGSYANGCISGCGTSRDGGDGGFPQSQYWSDFLIAPIENASFIGRFDYELADWISYNFRFDYGRSRYDAYRRPYRDDDRLTWLNGAGGATAYLDNPYLPASFRQLMVANKLTSTAVRRSYENFGQMTDYSDRQTLTVGNSFSGKLPGGFEWEAFWQYGKSSNDIHADNVPMASRFIAARDVIADPVTGAPVCRSAAARAIGCVPFNIFSTDPLTPEQRNWMMATRGKHREQKQTIYGANIAGSPFALPAGPVQAVLGVERRKESIHNVDDNG
ncbi:MAG: TonB-dependent receptor plug domain-containing protein, partial [Sphingobium sp.]